MYMKWHAFKYKCNKTSRKCKVYQHFSSSAQLCVCPMFASSTYRYRDRIRISLSLRYAEHKEPGTPCRRIFTHNCHTGHNFQIALPFYFQVHESSVLSNGCLPMSVITSNIVWNVEGQRGRACNTVVVVALLMKRTCLTHRWWCSDCLFETFYSNVCFTLLLCVADVALSY